MVWCFVKHGTTSLLHGVRLTTGPSLSFIKIYHNTLNYDCIDATKVVHSRILLQDFYVSDAERAPVGQFACRWDFSITCKISPIVLEDIMRTKMCCMLKSELFSHGSFPTQGSRERDLKAVSSTACRMRLVRVLLLPVAEPDIHSDRRRGLGAYSRMAWDLLMWSRGH